MLIWQTLYLLLLYLITSSLIFIITLKNSNKISNDSREGGFRQPQSSKLIMHTPSEPREGVTWFCRWSSSKQLQDHKANFCITSTFREGWPGDLGNQLCGWYAHSVRKTWFFFFFFFSSTNTSGTEVIRTVRCEFAEPELFHACVMNLSDDLFIFSILYW